MKPENPNQQAAAQASGGGLSTPADVAQLGDQLTAVADVLHERIMKEIQSYQGRPVPVKAQEVARNMLDDEQVLRQRANAMYLEAATLVVHSLGQSQQHIVKLTGDAAQKIKHLVKLVDTAGMVGRVLELSGAVLTGNPVVIMRALEDMHHMLDAIAAHNPPAASPAPSSAPSSAPPSAPSPSPGAS
jgi:chitinase